MKNAYDGLIRRLTMAKERLSELEEMSWETSKSEKQIEQEIKKTISKNCEIVIKSITNVQWEYQVGEKGTEECLK